jgi:hypothetical protein
VVGLFIRGTVDRSGLNVGWEHHEEAIPIHFIIAQWEAAQQGEPARRGVVIANSGPGSLTNPAHSTLR